MDDRSDGIILVMGVMGAGKSHFVILLRGQSVVDGHLMISETQKFEAVQILIDEDEKRSITVVDTPGFLDTRRGQAEIVAEITDYLAAQKLSDLPRPGDFISTKNHRQQNDRRFSRSPPSSQKDCWG
ncbi:hypothetical protein IWW34DRAFT_640222 [Fusarium oxysporum f. sp. albedinis]|nr:hypothetical protein IWW34DRAFT_640302 [Fusarium oxysporum f. sp. albedinis]KAI3571004.1 hypothetical protein IWW34DRAFT_640222 [Fusarium oxysporum f. sp. albedinis]